MMCAVQHRYALEGVLGPVWQSRYKAKLVEDQRYFDQLMVYIHLNPVKAGMVEDPARYRWSGHRELIRKVKGPETENRTSAGAVGGDRGGERYGVSVKGLAEVLGRHRVTVSSWISRGSAKRPGERSFEQQVDDLDSRIARCQP